MERTLVLVKPDAVQRGLIGEIISRFEQRGLKIVAMKLMLMDESLARRHYAVHEGKPFFNSLVSFITSGPIIAAVVEELVIRSWLIRFIVDPNKWDKVKIGTYTFLSFAITVAFFGFAHNRWLVGIISGIIFNLWLYYRKDIFSCIQAHASANLFLALYVVLTQAWYFW